MPALQPILFGSLGIGLAVIILFFPETRGRNLPETLEDWPSWNRGGVHEETDNTETEVDTIELIHVDLEETAHVHSVYM